MLRANDGATRLFGGLLAGTPIPDPANVLRLMIEPGPVRDAVLNWAEVASALLDRARREAVGGVLDLDTAALVNELRTRPEVAALPHGAEPPAGSPPVLGVRFRLDGAERAFFSVVSTIGTPIDITAQELRLEAFFPADEATRRGWVTNPS